MHVSRCGAVSKRRALADGMDCDVLVIGSGAAGLTSALKASHAGLTVTVIEKELVIGGITALSEGMIWVPLAGKAHRRLGWCRG